MRQWLVAGALACVLSAASLTGAVAQGVDAAGDKGVHVGNPSLLRNLVPAKSIEDAALKQYTMLKQEGGAKHALVPPSDPASIRLRRIARDLLPYAQKWNPRAKDWQWEVVLIRSKNINAFCLPGGKIAVFTGLVDGLKLTDDELALVMGHEISHALREHARARAAKSTLSNIGGRIVGSLIFGSGAGETVGAFGGNLLTLRFSRNDETEADLIGMELAARAGYNPAAGVTLWEKFAAAAKNSPPQWLSTHPANATRIKTIQDNLKDVEPLYERAKAAKASGAPMPAPFPGTEQPHPNMKDMPQ